MELLSRHNKKIKKQRIAQATTTLCACSPQSFTFQLLLDNDCSTSTISSALPEFSNVNCQISNNDVDRSRRELRIDIDNNNEHQLQENEKDVGSELDNDRYDVLTSQVQSLLPTVSGQHGGDDSIVTQSETILAYISSILFFEFDTSGQLTIINVDDTYLIPNDQELTNGATITFESISSTLNMSIPLEDQLVPGGAGLLMLGNNEAGDVILRSRFVWEYDLDCGVDADIVDDDNLGDTLGWIEFNDITPAKMNFCPASTWWPTLPPSSDAPTSRPTTNPTASPSLSPSSSPSKSPTQSPSQSPSQSPLASKTSKAKASKISKASKQRRLGQ